MRRPDLAPGHRKREVKEGVLGEEFIILLIFFVPSQGTGDAIVSDSWFNNQGTKL